MGRKSLRCPLCGGAGFRGAGFGSQHTPPEVDQIEVGACAIESEALARGNGSITSLDLIHLGGRVHPGTHSLEMKLGNETCYTIALLFITRTFCVVIFIAHFHLNQMGYRMSAEVSPRQSVGSGCGLIGTAICGGCELLGAFPQVRISSKAEVCTRIM